MNKLNTSFGRDFFISLLAVFKGTVQSYKRQYENAVEMLPKEQKIVENSFKEHMAKDPFTKNIEYSYLYVVLDNKKMKITALDKQLKKVYSVKLGARFSANWKYGKTNCLEDT